MLIGNIAPDFTAQAYVGGLNGRLETITLSAYRGRWVLLCFYPGDFTFV